MRLDPWDDAKAIAQRVAEPGARLVVIVAALAWCQKCRDFLPVFERQAADAPSNMTHVWLDLEEHSAFLGGFVPDDLPLQLTYEAGQLVEALAIRASGVHEVQELPDPRILAKLCTKDWAD